MAAGAALLGAAAALAGCATETLRPHARTFPADFKPPLSFETGQPVFGWGGNRSGGKVSPAHTPVIFVHGNTVDATYWRQARQAFREAGYSDDELWAPSYGWGDTQRFDNNDLSVPTLNAFVNAVRSYLQQKTGRRVPQFDIVAHSLGVTVVRQWLTQTNRWHEVRNFVAVAGANHGVWTSLADARGPSRAVSFELGIGSSWLEQLNRLGEVVGALRVLTLYDGTGRYDVLFPPPSQDSSALAGATNLPFDRERGGGYDHLELARSPVTLRAMLDFIQAAPEALPNAVPPQVIRSGNRLTADQPDAELRCALGGAYPNAAGTRPLKAIELRSAALHTCYASNPRTELAGPMTRYQRRSDAEPSAVPATLSLEAAPAAGVYAEPQTITLTASDPAAMIVYSTAGTRPDSGAALYRAPVFIAAPVVLTAVAISPDGRRSAPLRLDYNISLQYEDALHTLQRQFDPQTPVHFTGGNRSGN